MKVVNCRLPVTSMTKLSNKYSPGFTRPELTCQVSKKSSRSPLMGCSTAARERADSGTDGRPPPRPKPSISIKPLSATGRSQAES